MKFIIFLFLFFIFLPLSLEASYITKDLSLTDEMAMEAGMSEVSDLARVESHFHALRSEYVTSIPSQEDIDKVIASTKVVIVVNKSSKGEGAQTLEIFEDGQRVELFEYQELEGEEIKVFKERLSISTGTEKRVTGKSGRTYLSTTPKGFFRPTKIYEMYYSNTWKADMPNAVFFIGGIAIHATTKSHYHELGQRASGGCVRMRLEASEQVRLKVMESGQGALSENYKKVVESYRRWRVMNNTVKVSAIERYSGELLEQMISSWDTVIIVRD